MSDKDKVALYQQLLKLLVKGGREMDLAAYAIAQLKERQWRLDCCCPAVKAVVKRAFN